MLVERLLRREPDAPDLLFTRGEALRARSQAGDDDLALKALEAAERSGRAPAQTQRALGEIHRAQGRLEQARTAWRLYLERAPEAPDAALIRQSLQQGTP